MISLQWNGSIVIHYSTVNNRPKNQSNGFFAPKIEFSVCIWPLLVISNRFCLGFECDV